MLFSPKRANAGRALRRSLVLAACFSQITACGGGASTNPAPVGGQSQALSPDRATPQTTAKATATPTATPKASATPTARPSATATPSAKATSTPAPSPTPWATGSPCTAPNVSNKTAFYTSVYSYGNIVGHTYTQDNTYPAYQGYQINAYFAMATPTATPKPTASPKATASPKPTASPKATASPKPTATPNSATQEESTVYFGTLTVPSYDFTVAGSSGTNMTTAAPGCFVMDLYQQAGGTTGMDRDQAISSFDGDNAAFAGDVPFNTDTTETENIYSGTFTALTITNITADSGSGTFTLDNGVKGTIKITGSATAEGPRPDDARPGKFATSLRDRVLAEPRLLGASAPPG